MVTRQSRLPYSSRFAVHSSDRFRNITRPKNIWRVTWTVPSYLPVGITPPSRDCAICSPFERHGDDHQKTRAKSEGSWSFSQSVNLLPQIISKPVAIRSYESEAGILTVGVVRSIFERGLFMLFSGLIHLFSPHLGMARVFCHRDILS